MITTKFGNKERMTNLSTLIQKKEVLAPKISKVRKTNEKHIDGKWIKLPISAHDIVYIENSKKTTTKNLNKKTLPSTHKPPKQKAKTKIELNQVCGYKISTQKSIVAWSLGLHFLVKNPQNPQNLDRIVSGPSGPAPCPTPLPLLQGTAQGGRDRAKRVWGVPAPPWGSHLGSRAAGAGAVTSWHIWLGPQCLRSPAPARAAMSGVVSRGGCRAIPLHSGGCNQVEMACWEKCS